MSTKTLTELRRSVRTLYGDPDGITATDTEVDDLLKDGIDRVLSDCPWMYVTLDSTEALNTDAAGGAGFSSHAIAQIYSVEVETSTGVFTRLEAIHAGQLNVNVHDVTSVSSLQGYFMDGTRITFYPMYRSSSVTVRLVYSSNAIGAAYPTVAGDKLPAQFPREAEEAAIRHAVSRFHARDNNFDAAGFIDSDCENWIRKCMVVHNRPERGETLRVYDRSAYALEWDTL